MRLKIVIPGWSEGPDPRCAIAHLRFVLRAPRNDERVGYYYQSQKRGPPKRPPFGRMMAVSAVTMMMMVVVVPVRMPVGDRLQVNAGNAGRDVQPGLALQAD